MFVQHLDPGCDVEGDDHGLWPWDLADYPGDLAGGPAVQEPTEQRPGAAPWQQHGDIGPGLLVCGSRGASWAGFPSGDVFTLKGSPETIC